LTRYSLTCINSSGKRFLVVIDPLDQRLLVRWIVSTHLALELYTTPRLLLDSSMPGSGKTTALDHMSRLTCNPVQMSAVSSSAILVRVLENGIRTILIGEADKSLRFDKPGVAGIRRGPVHAARASTRTRARLSVPGLARRGRSSQRVDNPYPAGTG
jgi:hypothetical protein